MLFSTFMLYDDEGYVLLSLRNFSEHGHLYGGVYTQYGPLPYVLYDLLHRLGLPFTHTAGRCLTLAAWSGAGRARRASPPLTPLALSESVQTVDWPAPLNPPRPRRILPCDAAQGGIAA